MVTSNGEQTTDSVHEVPNQMQCIYLVQERWMKDESRKRETERKREERERANLRIVPYGSKKEDLYLLIL